MSKLIYMRQADTPFTALGELTSVRVRAGDVRIGGEDDRAGADKLFTAAWTGTTWTALYNSAPNADYRTVDLDVSATILWAVDQHYAWSYTGGVWTQQQTTIGHGVGEPTAYFAVCALSDTNVYLGGPLNGGPSAAQCYLRHWNGAAWSDVGIPGTIQNSGGYTINDLAVDPSGDLWYAGNAQGPPITDGSLIGSLGTGAAASIVGYQIYSIYPATTSDQWVTGNHTAVPVTNFHIFRNTGSGFTDLSGLPSIPAGNDGSGQLLAIHGSSSSNVWAVGYYGRSSGTLVQDAVLWHWDGSTWTATARPACAAASYIIMQDVFAVSSTDVWAVGYLIAAAGGLFHMLAWHFDGTSWTDRSP